MSSRKKIGILFLDEIHHVNHFITTAIELSKHCDVHILTYPDSHLYLYKSLKRLHGSNVIIEQLTTAPFRALTDKLKGRKAPRKGFWIKKNLPYMLKTFDALIFTDFFHRYVLEGRGENPSPALIKTTHGVAGRGYTFKPQQLDFDLQLLPGNFNRDALKKRNLLSENHAIVGNTKLDAVPDTATIKLFEPSKPIVLYNPHFSPPSSSWHTMGLQVLEYFYQQEEFNLIFAPHINLFQKVGGDDAKQIDPKYYDCKHIHIDLGSPNSVDMIYTNKADVYLGDVSSQVYEFIIRPRPCIFMNTEKVAYKEEETYRFWKCGDVIETVLELDNSLKNRVENFTKYKETQEQITAQNYYTEDGSTASERAANAIITFLDKT